MSDLFSHGFLLRALVAGVLVGGLAGYYGVFVVQRRMSFLGSGLAHAAFGGVALAMLVETDPLLIAVPFTLFIAFSINWVREHTKLATDTAVGVFFAVAVALGIVFLSLRERASYDAFTYLFGSILGVSRTDLYTIGILALLAIGMSRRYWGYWAFATFDREIALAGRRNVRRDDYLLTLLIAVTIVVSIKMVGILLIAAFLVIPAASARLVSPTFLLMTLISVTIGITSSVAGLTASYAWDLPSGATIILFQATVFGFATLYSVVRRP